jgi:putative transposase
MPIGLKRYYGSCDLHFITCSCYHRLPLLGSTSARDRFLVVLEEVRQKYCFKVAGYVVMPEHIHLLLGEPSHGTLSTVLQVVKQRVARSLPTSLRACEGHFWQRRFYDFNVSTEAKRAEKLGYLHANPVRRGLVRSASEWTWSSAGFFESGIQGTVRVLEEHISLFR